MIGAIIDRLLAVSVSNLGKLKLFTYLVAEANNVKNITSYFVYYVGT